MIPLPIRIFLNEQQKRCILVVDLSCIQLSEEQLTESIKALLEKIRIAAQRSFIFLNCVSSWDFKKLIEGKMSSVEMVLQIEEFIKLDREREETCLSVGEGGISFLSLKRKRIARGTAVVRAMFAEEKVIKPKNREHLLKEARKRASDISTVNFSSTDHKEQLHCLEKIVAFLGNYLREHHPKLMKGSSVITLAIEETTFLIGRLRSKLEEPRQEKEKLLLETASLISPLAWVFPRMVVKPKGFKIVPEKVVSFEYRPRDQEILPESHEAESIVESGPKKRYLSSKEGEKLLQSLRTFESSSFWKISKPWKKRLNQSNLFKQPVQSSSVQEFAEEAGVEGMGVEEDSLSTNLLQDLTMPRPAAPVEMAKDLFGKVFLSEGIFVGSDDEEELGLLEPVEPMVEAIQPHITQKRKLVSEAEVLPSTSGERKDPEASVAKKIKTGNITPITNVGLADSKVAIVSCFLPSIINLNKRLFVIKHVCIEDILEYINREQNKISCLLISKSIEVISNSSFTDIKDKQIHSLQQLLIHLRGLITLSTRLSEEEYQDIQESCRNLFIKIYRRMGKIKSSIERTDFSSLTAETSNVGKEEVVDTEFFEDSDEEGRVSDVQPVGLSKKLVPKNFIFPKFIYKTTDNTCVIGLYHTLPTTKVFVCFLEKIRLAKASYKCVCQVPIEGLKQEIRSPPKIIKALFLITCQFAYFYYRQKQKKDTETLISEGVVSSLRLTLKELDERYHLLLNLSYEGCSDEYHKDLQSMVDRYEIAVVFSAINLMPFFSYHVAHVNFLKQILQVKKSHFENAKINRLLVNVEMSLIIFCVHILRIIRNESISTLTVKTTDISFSIMDAPRCMSIEMEREQFLKQLKILLDQAEKSFRENVAFKSYKNKAIYSRVLGYLHTTSLWLNIAIDKGVLPNVSSLPKSLSPIIVYHLSVSNISKHSFHLEVEEYCYSASDRAITLFNKANALVLKLDNLLQNGVSSRETFVYGEHETTDIKLMIPLWYRCIEQMYWQLKKIHLMISVETRRNAEIKNLHMTMQLYKQCLVSLKTAYENLGKGNDIPKCEELAADLQPFLCLTVSQTEDLKEQLKAFSINF